MKDWLKGANIQWSILRFHDLETQETGFYRCEASSDTTTIKSTTVLKVNLGSGGKRGGGRINLDHDYIYLPGTFDDLFEAIDSPTNGIDGLSAHIEFQGQNPGMLLGQGHS